MNILSEEEIVNWRRKKINENDLKILNERKNENYENSDLIDNIKENMINLSLGIELINSEMKKLFQEIHKFLLKNLFFMIQKKIIIKYY